MSENHEEAPRRLPSAAEVLAALEAMGEPATVDKAEELAASIKVHHLGQDPDRTLAIAQGVRNVRSEQEVAPVRIKLKARAPSQAIAALYERFARNPLDDRQVLIVDEHQNYLALVVANTDPSGGMHVSEMITVDAGKGNASKALTIVQSIADEFHERITLFASKIGSNPKHLSTDALRDWYGRHGFECGEGDSDEGYDMVRAARPAPDLSPGHDGPV